MHTPLFTFLALGIMTVFLCAQSPVSISDKTSYYMISQSLEAVSFISIFRIVRSPGNLTRAWIAPLPIFLSNFKLPISRLRNFVRFGGKVSYRLVNRVQCPVLSCLWAFAHTQTHTHTLTHNCLYHCFTQTVSKSFYVMCLFSVLCIWSIVCRILTYCIIFLF